MHPDAAAFLRALRERELRPGPAAGEAFARAYRTLLQRANDPAARDAMLASLAEGLNDSRRAWEFGCVANVCGVLVERGGDPRIAAEPILNRLTTQFAAVPELVRALHTHFGIDDPKGVPEHAWEEIGGRAPDHGRLIDDWRSLQLIGPAAMALLVRDVALRQRVRQGHDALRHAADLARPHSVYAYYVAELLESADDLPVLVLDLPAGRGWRVRLTAVRNNFHFFTLLQAALGVAAPDAAAVVAVAKGERMLSDLGPGEPTGDAALWAYLQWPGLTAADRRAHWAWGEAKPADLAALAGERIVLLEPLETPRAWDVGYFAPLHPALRPAVAVEATLPPEEVAAWKRRLGEAG